MKNTNNKSNKIGGLVLLLPFVYGCGGGGGLAALGSLFLGGGLASLGGGAGLGAQIATISQPEPATMMLMGSGLAAMAFFKSKRNK